jgi:hypothetical protein
VALVIANSLEGDARARSVGKGSSVEQDMLENLPLFPLLGAGCNDELAWSFESIRALELA